MFTKHILITVLFFIAVLLIKAQYAPTISEHQIALGSTNVEEIQQVLRGDDGHIIVVSTTRGNNADIKGFHGGMLARTDLWVIKIHKNTGDTIWNSRAIGSTGWESGTNLPNDVSANIGKDGHIYVAAQTNTANGDVSSIHSGIPLYYDLWVFKINKNNGSLIWASRGLGGSQREEGSLIAGSSASRVTQTRDNHVAVATNTRSNDGDIRGYHGGTDMWVVKLNRANGDTLWTTRALGGSADEQALGLINSIDGHLILAGNTNSSDGDIKSTNGGGDVWIVKIHNTTGDTIWTSRGLGGSSGESLGNLFSDVDGNLIVVGTTKSSDGDINGFHGGVFWGDLWVAKLDVVTGDTIWFSKALGGPGDEFFSQSLLTQEGSILIACGTDAGGGDINNFHGGIDFWSVKIDASTGNVIWKSDAIGGVGDDALLKIDTTCDGGYILSGNTTTLDTNDDISQVNDSSSGRVLWCVKLDKEGQKEWDKTWSDGSLSSPSPPGTTSFAPTGGYFFQAEKGGAIIIGESRRDLPDGDKVVSGKGGGVPDQDLWISKVKWFDASFVSDTVCLGEKVSFDNTTQASSNVKNKIKWIWSFGDGKIDSTFAPEYLYSQSDSFEPRLIAEIQCQIDTVYGVAIVIDSPQLNLPVDTTVCQKAISLVLSASQTDISYQYSWSTGDTIQQIEIDTPGLYWVNISNKTCFASDTIFIELGQKPTTQLTPLVDTNISCIELPKLSISKSGADSYQWMTDSIQSGSTLDKLKPNYLLILRGTDTSSGCNTMDSMALEIDQPTSTRNTFNVMAVYGDTTIEWSIHNQECSVFVPNVFSKSSSASNTNFKPILTGIPSSYELVIINRLGKTVFITNDYDEAWEGDVNNSNAVYSYVLSVAYNENVIKKVGTVSQVQ